MTRTSSTKLQTQLSSYTQELRLSTTRKNKPFPSPPHHPSPAPPKSQKSSSANHHKCTKPSYNGEVEVPLHSKPQGLEALNFEFTSRTSLSAAPARPFGKYLLIHRPACFLAYTPPKTRFIVALHTKNRPNRFPCASAETCKAGLLGVILRGPWEQLRPVGAKVNSACERASSALPRRKKFGGGKFGGHASMVFSVVFVGSLMADGGVGFCLVRLCC